MLRCTKEISLVNWTSPIHIYRSPYVIKWHQSISSIDTNCCLSLTILCRFFVTFNISFFFYFRYRCKLFGLCGRKRALVLGLVSASIFCVVVSVIPQTEGNMGRNYRYFIIYLHSELNSSAQMRVGRGAEPGCHTADQPDRRCPW